MGMGKDMAKSYQKIQGALRGTPPAKPKVDPKKAMTSNERGMAKLKAAEAAGKARQAAARKK